MKKIICFLICVPILVPSVASATIEFLGNGQGHGVLGYTQDKSIAYGYIGQNERNATGGWLWSQTGGYQSFDLGPVRGVSADGSAVAFNNYVWTETGGLVETGVQYTSGIAGDGSTVFGYHGGANGYYGGIWSQATGFVDMGMIDGGGGTSGGSTRVNYISAASYDGSILTGWQHRYPTKNAYRAYAWTQDSGYELLGGDGYLAGGSYPLEGGETEISVAHMAADASKVVGWGYSDLTSPYDYSTREVWMWTEETNEIVGLGLTGTKILTSEDFSVIAVGDSFWTEEGSVIQLPSLAAGACEAKAVSANGRYICGRTDGSSHAFVYDTVTDSAFDLTERLGEGFVDTDQWWVYQATWVSDDGRSFLLDAVNQENYDDRTLIAVTIPEPATMTLLGLGVLALIRRRRKV